MIYAMHAINLWHATNHWCNRGSIRLLGCPDSLQLVATWCKMVMMIGDSDVDIFNSRSHAPLVIQSLTRSLMYCWECLHVTCSMLSSSFLGSLWLLGCNTILLNWAGRSWCKMATMFVMAMGVIMLAMVVIMLAMVVMMVIVAPSFVDSFRHWLVHNCIVKHVHVLHAWYHHYCRVIAIAGLWHHWHRLAPGGSLFSWSQFMYISVKLTCTCLLLLSCLCN